MNATHHFRFSRPDSLALLLSLFVFSVCLVYAYFLAFVIPNTGFTMDLDWNVLYVDSCADPNNCLQARDKVLAIDDYTHEEFLNNRTRPIFSRQDSDSYRASIRVLRDGRVFDIAWVRGPISATEKTVRLLGAVLPLLFWLMGTFAVIYVTPRDRRWLLLVLFLYTMSIWLAAGAVSYSQLAYSSIAFRVALWLFIPISIHLHMMLPSRILRRRQDLYIFPIYLLAAVMIFLELLVAIDRSSVLLGLLLSVLISAALLIARFFTPSPPADRAAVRLMLSGAIIAILPLITVAVLAQTSAIREEQMPGIYLHQGLAILAIPIWPLTYLYAIYKQRLGNVEFRANRLLTAYAFFLVYITLFISLFLISSRILPFGQSPIGSSLLISIVFVTIATASRRRFEALVARVIHRIQYSQEEILGVFAERLPTAFDHFRLVRIIQDEILPTLLVRQSALYLFEEKRLQPLYEQGLQDSETLTSSDEIAPLLERSGEYIDTLERHPQAPWVRLAVPVTLQNKTIGVWLFGKRDPDDFYPVGDIVLLSKLANQIAPVVENANLFEQAQQEIAHRRKAEEEIRQSNERFKNLFEATLEGIALVRDGVVLEVNRALCDMLGYDDAELIGRPISDFVVEGMEQARRQPIGGEAAIPVEGGALSREGKRFDIELASKGYLFQGEQVNVVAIRDITQRKRDQTEKEKLQQQLLQAQKMEAIGRLTAGLAHDFNNLLTGILGYSNLILDRHPKDRRLYNDMLEVKKAGEKAASLTKQMLAFSRQQLMSPKIINLNTVLVGIKNLLGRTLGEDVELSIHLDPALAPVKVDPTQIEQVIVNLAVNARDAMPNGGQLRIETSTVKIHGPIAKYTSLPSGDHVLLSIRDTGVGISPEIKAHIFEPFFTTKEIGRGTGLGLSTVYGIVKQSSGYVYVDSEPGHGSTFKIFLPPILEVEKVEEVEERPPAPAQKAVGTETILLVEDEDVVRMLTTTLLRDSGYRVLDAASATEAVRICKGFEEPIHLLLTDVTMPGMSGPQLAHQLCSMRPELKVIYMSGYSNETAFNDEGLRSKAILLQKPFPPAALSRKLREILDAR